MPKKDIHEDTCYADSDIAKHIHGPCVGSVQLAAEFLGDGGDVADMWVYSCEAHYQMAALPQYLLPRTADGLDVPPRKDRAQKRALRRAVMCRALNMCAMELDRLIKDESWIDEDGELTRQCVVEIRNSLEARADRIERMYGKEPSNG